jgi:hypothetical protein
MATFRAATFTVLSLLAACSLCLAAQDLPPQTPPPSQSNAALHQRALRDGQARVIVELRLPPEF